jgi:hypothetical protein
MIKPITYIAVPYSHPSARVRRERFMVVNKVAGNLMKRGYIVYSPISHTHPIASACKLPSDWKYWQRVDTAYLRCSNRLIVLCLDGWRESVGVQAEIKLAKKMKIKINYINVE